VTERSAGKMPGARQGVTFKPLTSTWPSALSSPQPWSWAAPEAGSEDR